jgi:pimeloyl-ACP methyl ester carboxylesterase
MGGKVAMLFALTHPEYIASLSIIDIAPKAYTANEIGSGRAAEHRLILQTLTALNLDEITSRTQAENFFESRISHAPTRQFLLKNLKRTQSGFEWGINLGLLAQSLPQIMEAIQPPLESKPPQFPTLFVRGANSDYILDSDIPAISTLFPTAQYCTIPKAGHWIHAEQPALFISTLINFVKSV